MSSRQADTLVTTEFTVSKETLLVWGLLLTLLLELLLCLITGDKNSRRVDSFITFRQIEHTSKLQMSRYAAGGM